MIKMETTERWPQVRLSALFFENDCHEVFNGE